MCTCFVRTDGCGPEPETFKCVTTSFYDCRYRCVACAFAQGSVLEGPCVSLNLCSYHDEIPVVFEQGVPYFNFALDPEMFF